MVLKLGYTKWSMKFYNQWNAANQIKKEKCNPEHDIQTISYVSKTFPPLPLREFCRNS